MTSITNEQREARVQFYVENMMAWRRNMLSDAQVATNKLNSACGYPDTLDVAQYKEFYSRLGIATRVVEVYPEETWRVPPEVVEDDDPDTETPFEQALNDVFEEHNVWSYLERIDKLSGLGRYGVLLIGLDDGLQLSQAPIGINEDGKSLTAKNIAAATAAALPKRQLMFLRCFDEQLAPIATIQTATNSRRMGQPLSYNLKLVNEYAGLAINGPLSYTDEACHWGRLLHVADNVTTCEALGTARLENVYNHLYDYRKIVGGSAEMLWRGGFPGISFNVDPELLKRGVTIDKDAMKEEMECYSEGLRRYIMLTGAEAKTHQPNVADPKNHAELQIEAICAAKAVPKRILMGSEQGQLAAQDDRKAWNDRIRKRQYIYVTPMIIRAFVQRLIDLRVLPVPPKGFKVVWPDLAAPSKDEQAATAAKITAALVAYANSSALQQICPPAEFYAIVMEWDVDRIQQVMDAAEQYIIDNPPNEGEFDEDGNPLELEDDEEPTPGEDDVEDKAKPKKGKPVAAE
jgi:hypothetical protein